MILESSHIDHTNLKSIATSDSILRLCNEAIKYQFRGVCVNPCHVQLARSKLERIKVVTVIGFPLGANSTLTKIFEAKQALKDGADEIDIVWDIGAFREERYVKVLLQLSMIVKAVRDIKQCVVKVIVETGYFEDQECVICHPSLFMRQKLERAYDIVQDSGADYIKTSTGFNRKGATLRAVTLWNNMNGNLKIKASGGIISFAIAQHFIDRGADVIGTSHGVKIMEAKHAYSKLSR